MCSKQLRKQPRNRFVRVNLFFRACNHKSHCRVQPFARVASINRCGGTSTAGVVKDVVMLGGFQEAEFDFVADNPRPTLFHCHQQLHMDFGFMAVLHYA
jgi:FtsP/CotA-like multicopper oxidase with cupredoxin domain